MEHASVGVSELNFRLFRMSYKARSNLRCFFNTIFCLFNFQQSQENPPQPLLQSDMGEDWSSSESESEYTEHASDTGDMKFCDGNDIRFIRTRSWISTSKRELLNFCNLKEKKQSSVFTLCTAPQCNVYVHFTTAKNCLQGLHSTQFCRKYKYM